MPVVIDHRGRKVRRHTNVLAANPAARAYRRQFPARFAANHGLFLWVLLSMLVSFTAGLLTPIGTSGSSRNTLLSMSFGVASLSIAIYFVVNRLTRHHRLHGRTRTAIWLAYGLCPTCAFDLSHSPTQPDACTLCPECGAAWRLASERDPRIGDMPQRRH